MGGDGLLGAVAGELRGTDGVLGVLPGGRGNDFARKLGIGDDPERACDVLAAGRERAGSTWPTPAARAYLGIASAGFDSDVQDIANATRMPLGELVYVYATLRALRGWRHAHWQVVVDGEAHDVRRVLGRGGQLRRVRRRHAPRPGRVARRRPARRRARPRAAPKRRYLASLPQGRSRARTSASPDLTLPARRARSSFHADRPFAAYADGDPIADLPVTITVVPRALKVLVP